MNYTKTQERNIIFLLFIIPFLIGTGVDLYVPSLPAITNYFHVDKDLVQLTIAFYMLGYGGGQIFFGVLSDSIGRRKVLLISAIFYTIISLLSVLATNIYLLIFARFLQGLCIAGLGTLCRAIATDCFVELSLAKIMTFISISFALGPIIGPFIGGYLQHYFNWQANFYFFGAYGALIYFYALFKFPETNKYLQIFNYRKIFTSIKSVLMHPFFILGTVLASLVYACLVMFNIIGPFLIQVVLKYSVVAYGHIALLLGFGYFLGNIFNRVFISYFKPVRVAFVALCSALFFAGILLYLGIYFRENIYALLLPVLFIFFTFGLIFPNIMAKTVSYFPKNAGTASALFGTFLGSTVFLMTLFSTKLKTTTHVPMAMLYVGVLAICLLLFFISHKVQVKIETQ